MAHQVLSTLVTTLILAVSCRQYLHQRFLLKVATAHKMHRRW